MLYALYFLSIVFQCQSVRILFDEDKYERFSHSQFVVNTSEPEDTVRRILKASDPNDHKVTKLPGLSSSISITQYAGHITVDEAKNGNIFYWLFESPQNSKDLPLLVWLNGGPGCSSMDGLFLELGPFKLDKNGNTVLSNPSSWHNVANLLFIDQPVGTGLSYTTARDGYCTNDEQVNKHFYKFMQSFLDLHKRYVTTVDDRKTSRPFYMAGESHAGHYIPSMSAYILNQNNNLQSSDVYIKLEGIALGNPWMEPLYQYDASDFSHGFGIITQTQKNKLKENEKVCRSFLKQGRYNQKICFGLLDEIIDGSTVSGSEKVLMYDVRRTVHNTRSFPPGKDLVEAYLNRKDVLSALHATSTPQKFVECSDPPFYALSHQDGKGISSELSTLLNANVRTLVYSGQYDVVCNHLGSEKVLDALQWDGRDGWSNAKPNVWILNKKPAGHLKTYKNLQSLLVLDSGHMVPLDLPATSLEMITNFIQNKPFSGGQSGVGVSQVNAALSECPVVPARTLLSSLASKEENKATIRKGRKNVHAKSITTNEHVSRLLDVPVTPAVSPAGDDAANYHVSIALAIPLEESIVLRLRVSHTSSTSGTHSKHSSSSTSVGTETIKSLLPARPHPYEIYIEPGGHFFALDPQIFDHTKTTDIEISSLSYGIDYSFTVRRVNTVTGMSHVVSKRAMTIRQGCYNPHITQCCSRGECIPGSSIIGGDVSGLSVGPKKVSSTIKSHCKCDQGYSGQYCNHYEISHPHDGSISNVSAADALICPNHFVVNNESIALTYDYHLNRIVRYANPTLNTHVTATTSGGSEAETVHKYCSKEGECSLLVELLMHPTRAAINTWANAQKFPTYKASSEDLLSKDVHNALLGSSFPPIVTKDSDPIVSIRTSMSTEKYDVKSTDTVVMDLSVVTEHHQQLVEGGAATTHHHSYHRHHDDNFAVYCVVVVSGGAGEVNLAVSNLLQQLSDANSMLHSGLITSHVRANYLRIINNGQSAKAGGVGLLPSWLTVASLTALVHSVIRTLSNPAITAYDISSGSEKMQYIYYLCFVLSVIVVYLISTTFYKLKGKGIGVRRNGAIANGCNSKGDDKYQLPRHLIESKSNR